MRELRTLIARVAPAPLPVLIQGPTGSGKELVARALHRASGRSGAFVAFNSAAIPEPLFEDALFGHVKGAFSGAVGEHAGYLAEANGGAVFLDEIGRLPLTAQAKLLRAIETREFRPVGAHRDRTSDFRVLAALNDDIEILVRTDRFREDLAYRLSGLVLSVPPLNERREDIPLLVRHFAAQGPAGGARAVSFTDSALRVLQERVWLGNVRELKSAVERLCTLAATPLITADDVHALLARPASRITETSLEAQALREALDAAGWDTKAVARVLGVDRVTVYRRMKRFSLTRPPRPERDSRDDDRHG